ncbi:ATP-binding protein [Sulfurospirillum sp. 1612]|uniref:ATP-binding protein n=1 Tax=Sulfurospirillum sp. 1612 TaxID=3094835 RepID=UPI002F9301CB
MNLLETLYEIHYKNDTYFDRKTKILSNKTLILGPRKSGKSHLVIDYLQEYAVSSYLYIDFLDERLNTEEIESKKLETFIQNNHIKLLILENFDFSINLPKVDKIIITSDDSTRRLENFHTISLYPLDFEEFILFDKKHSNIEQLFNQFANQGSFPEIATYHDNDRYNKMQKITRDLFQTRNEFLVFKKFCELQGTKISLFQLYNQLKPKMKISKDFIYKCSADLQHRELIVLLEKYQQPKAAKKVYLFDFALKNALSFKRDFLKRFENMVFLELYKRNKEIFYNDIIDFWLPLEHEGIICAPFTPIVSIKAKVKKMISHLSALQAKKIWITTLGNEGAFEQDGVTFVLIPFWDWALQN